MLYPTNSRILFYVNCYIKQLEVKINDCQVNPTLYASSLDHYYKQKAAAENDKTAILKTLQL